MFFHNYPYTDAHELNLDWILSIIKELLKKMEDFVAANTIKYADPIAWNITSQYEKNTVVIDSSTGDAYLSVKPVPAGVSLSNTDFWTPIFNYSAQITSLMEQIAAANEGASSTATASRSVNDLVWLNGKLAIITSAMNPGDAYVENTNFNYITVEDYIGLSIVNALTGQNELNLAAVNDINITAGADINLTGANVIINGINLAKIGIVNVKDYGATGDGLTDDTAAIQSALDASKNVYFPAGTYIVSDTLIASGNSNIMGAGAERTIIKRAQISSQHWDTMQIGSASDHADCFNISGIWFLRDLIYDNSGITNPILPDVCHLRVFYGQNFDIHNCMFWRCPINIRLINCTVGRIFNNTIETTIWDTQNSNLQEGSCAIKIGNEDTPVPGYYCQLIDIHNNHIGGSIFSGIRTVTWNGVSVSTNINIGAREGITVSECEGLNIHNNYIGGFAYNGITLNPTQGAIDNTKITANFLDPSGETVVQFTNNATYGCYRTIIANNGFNMQMNGVHAITMSGSSSSPSAIGCIIEGNVMQNCVGSALSLFGGKGVIIRNNQISAYNCHNVTASDPNWDAGIMVADGTKYTLSGNAYGGDVNTLDQDDNCLYGVYFISSSSGTATDEIDFGINSAGQLIHT